jgi:multiple sugar transport system substrate-binding protein
MYMSFTHAEPGVFANQFVTDVDWGVAFIPVPGGEVNVRGAQSFSPSSSFLINAAARDIEAVWKVYSELLLDEDFLRGYFEGGFGISIVPWIIETANMPLVYLDNPLLLITEFDSMWPGSPASVNPTAIIIEGQSRWDTYAQIIYANANIERTLADLTNRYNRAYRNGIRQNLIPEIIIPNFNPMQPMR